MASQTNLTGSGFSPAQASNIIGQIQNSVTAAGTTQATATAIYADVNIVTNTAASTGVILPANRNVGDRIAVINLGANALTVYPQVNATLNNYAANASITIPAGKSQDFICTGSTSWAEPAALFGQTQTGISAAGTTQGTATALTADVNVISTAALNSGVILPSNRSTGDRITVINQGANALAVYPQTGAAIATNAANAAQSIAVNKSADFIYISSTYWAAVVSA